MGLAAVVFAAALPAQADELLVGALRDQDGGVVAGAAVTAVDAKGAVLARDRSAADGTFALATPSRPVAVLVVADDADPLRVAVPHGTAPLAAIVRRHRSADLIPSVADVAALPAGGLDAIGSMLPYRIAFPGAIADRWLARGRGVTSVEGLPFYRRGDGADTTSLLPARAFGALVVRDALQAPWYGDRAGAGVVDARLFDREDAVRLTTGDSAFAVGRDPIVLGATSWDSDGVRRLLAARGTGALGPVSASVVALIGDAPGAHYAGAGTEMHAATRTFDAVARAAVTADIADAATRNGGSVADASFDVSGRGPNAIAVRARWRDERGTLGNVAVEHHDSALVFGTTRGNVARVTAAVALAQGDSYEPESRTVVAILPSLALDTPLGANWTLHLGGGASSLGTPGFGIARSSLGEASIAYTDRRRLRAEFVAYTEGDSGPAAVNRGFAASLGWEIAPRLSLRAWSLRDGDRFYTAIPLYAGGPTRTISNADRFDRDVVWLTWDAAARFDLVLRERTLEGSVRVPLGARYAFSLGSYRRRDATRAVSFGLVAR
ncbi:MAG: hypothetical protein QOF71_1502 [Candidatus Eremiobacteraeota bacterium]|nr:hypothetical protein [Candidatus Eremiobacteraeota bacterium]